MRTFQHNETRHFIKLLPPSVSARVHGGLRLQRDSGATQLQHV